MNPKFYDLHDALLDIVGFINRPEPDDVLIAEAGIPLDRALFPLLVRVARRGPIGVVELAELAGRDYTTVSRQVARLEELGLVTRRANARDKRIREAEVTDKGCAMTVALDEARERLAKKVFADWSNQDRQDLTRLLRQFADSLNAWAGRPGGGEGPEASENGK